MVRWMTMTPQEETEWAVWLAERPVHIRALAERLPPWNLYLLKTSGHRVKITAYSEGPGGSVSLKVAVTGEYNFVAFEREVFGIQPDDLEPCDFPPPGELVGSADMDHDSMREFVRLRKKDSDAAEWYIDKHGRDAFEAKFITPRVMSFVDPQNADPRQAIRDACRMVFGSEATEEEITTMIGIATAEQNVPEKKP